MTSHDFTVPKLISALNLSSHVQIYDLNNFNRGVPVNTRYRPDFPGQPYPHHQAYPFAYP